MDGVGSAAIGARLRTKESTMRRTAAFRVPTATGSRRSRRLPPPAAGRRRGRAAPRLCPCRLPAQDDGAPLAALGAVGQPAGDDPAGRPVHIDVPEVDFTIGVDAGQPAGGRSHRTAGPHRRSRGGPRHWDDGSLHKDRAVLDAKIQVGEGVGGVPGGWLDLQVRPSRAYLAAEAPTVHWSQKWLTRS